MSEVVDLEVSEAKTDLGKDFSNSTVEEEKESNTPQNKAPWVFTEKRKESLIKANKARVEKKNLSNNLKLDYVEAKKEIQKAYQEASKKLVLEKKLEMSTQKKEKAIKQEEKEESIPIVSVIPIASNPSPIEKPVEKIPEIVKEIVKVKEMEEEEDKIDIKKFIKQLIQEEKGKKGRKSKDYDSDTSEEEPPKKSKKRKQKPPPPSDSEESEEETPPKKTAAPARPNPYLYQSGYLPTLMRGKRSGCIF